MLKKVIQFRNRNDQILRGILYSPENYNQKNKDLFVFPNGGVMGAEGDYRAHVSMAKMLVDKGHFVMRFSPTGLGYSDGEIDECLQKNLFNQIENGLFVNDIKCAVNYAISADEFKSITLIGICGGAISSFMAAAEIKEIDRVVPIGIPVILDDEKMDYDQRIMALDKHFIIKSYIDKLLSATSWKKLLTGKSNIKQLKKLLGIIYQKKDAYLTDNDDKTKFSPNPLFFDAARKMFKKKKKILFVFGDTDGFLWEFETLFLNKFYLNASDRPFDLYISKGSNHMLSLQEMQIDVTKKIISWVTA